MGDMGELGILLAQMRRQAGWSQETLAEAIGVNASYISRVESGHKLPSWTLLERFAEVLRVPLVNLLIAAGRLPDTAALESDVAAFVAAHPGAADAFELARLHPEILPGLVSYARYLVSQLEGDNADTGRPAAGGDPA